MNFGFHGKTFDESSHKNYDTAIVSRHSNTLHKPLQNYIEVFPVRMREFVMHDLKYGYGCRVEARRYVSLLD